MCCPKDVALRRGLLPQVPFPHRPALIVLDLHYPIATRRPASQRPRNPKPRDLAALALLLFLPALLDNTESFEPLSFHLVLAPLLD